MKPMDFGARCGSFRHSDPPVKYRLIHSLSDLTSPLYHQNSDFRPPNSPGFILRLPSSFRKLLTSDNS